MPKTYPQSRNSQVEDEAGGFQYCETLFQYPGRKSECGDSRKGSPDVVQSKQLKLYRFLERNKLEFLFDTLIDAGYDDLDQISFQMRSSLPLDLSTLESIGIRKYSHRVLLLSSFERLSGIIQSTGGEEEGGVSMCCGKGMGRGGSLDTFPDLKEWLREAGAEMWYQRFVEAGFADVDTLLQTMNSTCPITDEVLKMVVRVDNPHDRLKLLHKLKYDSHVSSSFLDKESKVSACTCTLM